MTLDFSSLLQGRLLAARLLHELTKAIGDSELCLFKSLFFHATQPQSCAWQNIISILCLFQLKEANQEPDRLMGTEPHFLACPSTWAAKRKAGTSAGPAPLGSWEGEQLPAPAPAGSMQTAFPAVRATGQLGISLLLQVSCPLAKLSLQGSFSTCPSQLGGDL